MDDITSTMTTDNVLASLAGEYYYVMERRHPYYLHTYPVWKRATNAYKGGRQYVRKTLTKHPSETDDEFKYRQEHSYNINLIKYSAQKFGDYIFSKAPRRNGAAEEIVKDFDRIGKSANTVMREIFDYYTIYGLAWVFVDMPVLEGNLIDLKSKADNKIRPYVNAVAPMDVPDWDFDEKGELNWIIREEIITEKHNPLVKPVRKRRRTLYTKEYWQTFDEILDGGEGVNPTPSIVIGARHYHDIGRVPVLAYTSVLFNRYFNQPAIDDVLTIHDAVLHSESELVTNILKQTYGQLVLPSSTNVMAQRIKSKLAQENPDLNVNDPTVQDIIRKEVNVVMSRTKYIIEDPEERNIARYIQPAGANIETIIKADDRLINMIIRLYGFLVGVETTQRESAESKSADNISLAAQLTSITTRLEELELKIWELLSVYDSTISIPTIKYNKNYDINELKSVIAAIVELVNIDAGVNYQKEVKRTALHVLDRIQHVSDDAYEDIERDIESNASSGKPITFEAQASHLTEASGSTPDNITARTDYQKGTASVKRTETL
jgi:hypothetical protein